MVYSISRRSFVQLSAALAGVSMFPAFAAGEDGAVLLPFDAGSLKVGSKPDLPRRVGSTFMASNEFNLAQDKALRAGAEDAGLEYVSVSADGSIENTLQQAELILNQGVASFYYFTANQPAEEPLMTSALSRGINVANVAGWPCVMQINGSQAAAGRKQAQAAIDWIAEHLKDRAVVAYINNDEIEFLRPRDEAIRSAFAEAGIKITVDQAPQQRTDEGGFNLMNAILQSNPDVNVVLGAPYVTAGVVSAIEAAGITDPDFYVSVGNPTDAELDLIAKGTVLREGLLFPFEPMCYAIGQLTNDWLEGKPVPRAITVPGGNLLVQGAEGVAQYRADIADLKALFASDRFGLYVGYWGTTRFEDMQKDVWHEAWQQTNV